MSKQIKTNVGGSEGGYKRGVPTKFVSRNLMPVKGVMAQNQFAPPQDGRGLLAWPCLGSALPPRLVRVDKLPSPAPPAQSSSALPHPPQRSGSANELPECHQCQDSQRHRRRGLRLRQPVHRRGNGQLRVRYSGCLFWRRCRALERLIRGRRRVRYQVYSKSNRRDGRGSVPPHLYHDQFLRQGPQP